MIKAKILKSLGRAKFVFLSTLNDERYPETRAMMNLRNVSVAPHLEQFFKENDKIYFSTNTSSEKMAHVRRKSKSSIYILDEGRVEGLLLIGHIYEVKDDKIKKAMWDDSWVEYYEGGVEGDYSLLEFIPSKSKFYKNNTVLEDDLLWYPKI